MTIAARRRNAFTLIELLVVIAIVALLLVILLPALSRARSLAIRTKEMAACQQLLIAYHAYATDNGGALLPGVANGNWLTQTVATPRGMRLIEAHDDQGQLLHWRITKQYAWRLAPYLGYDKRSLIADKSLYREYAALPNRPMAAPHEGGAPDVGYQYAFSYNTSFGINATYLGGEFIKSEEHPVIEVRGLITRDDQVLFPADLLVFATARDGVATEEDGRVVPGAHRVRPPIANGRILSYYGTPNPKWDPSRPPIHFGFLDLRHDVRAITGQFDGHVDLMPLEELRQMKHWSGNPREFELPS